MKALIAEFGTDHYYQADGFFNAAKGPWLDAGNYKMRSYIQCDRILTICFAPGSQKRPKQTSLSLRSRCLLR